jgi:large subunit ribosomal protein L24
MGRKKFKNISSVTKPKIKKGDTVLVTAGKDKGKQGEVLRVFPVKARALVQDVNKAFRHTKPTEQNPRGGRVEKEMPIAISNLKVVGSDNVAGRVGIKRVDDGKGSTKRVRFVKSSGQDLD